MPALPAEPSPQTQTTTANGPIPVMPDLVNLPAPSIPTDIAVTPWATPGVLENVSFKLITPAEAKALRSGNKGAKKAKSQPVTN